MIALDICHGEGGWTDGFLAEGFVVHGFDIREFKDYKGIHHRKDVLTLTRDEIMSYDPDFIVASTPCEQFSIFGMPHFHPNPPPPVLGLSLFNHIRALLHSIDIPWIMENVRNAEAFVGKAVNHCGPFYLWGTGVPAIFPPDAYKVQKGFGKLSAKWWNKVESGEWTKEQLRRWSQTQKAPNAARAARIPLSISRYVAACAKARYSCI